MKKLFAVIVAGVTAAACMSGPRKVADPGNYLEANSPERMWIVLEDGTRLMVDGPRVISDTVFGWADGEEFSIPVSELKEVRVRQLSIFRSVVLPTALTGAAITSVIAFRSTEATHDPDTDSTIDVHNLPRP
ncbi:MAG: hypothetical protein EXR93_07035 [Gemmatimonadetes bacterium]|nr:hypothetical protein [Gemmatimonadota bacterium]